MRRGKERGEKGEKGEKRGREGMKGKERVREGGEGKEKKEGEGGKMRGRGERRRMTDFVFVGRKNLGALLPL